MRKFLLILPLLLISVGAVAMKKILSSDDIKVYELDHNNLEAILKDEEKTYSLGYSKKTGQWSGYTLNDETGQVKNLPIDEEKKLQNAIEKHL